jgi:uncharacterized protein (DUF302 family)
MMRKIRGATRGGVVAAFVMMLLLGVPAAGQAEDNPALWKREVKDNYAAVLEDVKSALEANQFSITGESDLAKALAKNRHVFGQGKWNTIGFQEATAVSFCSLLFNQEVFNLNMDYSILCPFKVVLYSLESRPGMVTILMVRPTYLLAHFKDPSAREIGQKIEDRIVWALDEALKH